MNISELFELCRKHGVRMVLEACSAIDGYTIRIIDSDLRGIDRVITVTEIEHSALSSEAIFTNIIYLMLEQLGIKVI